jgi:hypothetical protein
VFGEAAVSPPPRRALSRGRPRRNLQKDFYTPPSELLYLKAISTHLESIGKSHLLDNVTIVPVGGLDKLVTFISLLGASGLKLVVLHDYRGAPEQKLTELVKSQIIAPKFLLNASQFRNPVSIGATGAATDTEDLFDENLYLEHFNNAYKTELGGKSIAVSDLPTGTRIVERIERYLEGQGIKVRPSGGFNHFRVAQHFVTNPPKRLSDDIITRFSALFDTVNRLLG